MSVHYQDDAVALHHGDCLDILRSLPDCSVDAVVTDPPYGLVFMGKKWDDHVDNAGFGAWCLLWAAECLRVLKPGGHLLAFGGSRTWHRLACAVEDAGFEVRDSIAWLYGSGFPKSLDVSKAIDKQRTDRWEEVLPVTRAIRRALVETGVTRRDMNRACGLGDSDAGSAQSWVTATADGAHKPRVPTVDQWAILRDLLGLQHLDAEVWRLNGRKGTPGEAWGQREVTGLSPHSANRATNIGYGADLDAEGQRLVTAPATDAARTWQGWGTALKPAFEPIVVGRKPLSGTVAQTVLEHGTGALNIAACRVDASDKAKFPVGYSKGLGGDTYAQDEYSRAMVAQREDPNPAGRWPANAVLDDSQAAELDRQSGIAPAKDTGGGASRFFPTFRYEAKAPTAERPRDGAVAHPTVKPLDLMRWLVRLVTPPGGTVLEPFAGSGTTAEACVLEGFRCIAIEREADYLPLIVQRLTKPLQPGFDFDGDAA